MSVPSAVICTSRFVKEAGNISKILGALNYPVVEITHPLSSITNEEIKERAVEAAGQIIEILTGKKYDLPENLYSLTADNSATAAVNKEQALDK